MEGSLLSILFLGFILGIKHAIEPDHVIAVSTIASQSKKLSRSSLAGVFWGIGHTTTLFVFGIILIVLKGNIQEKWAMSFEFLVGIMLVYLGVSSILSFKKIHHHEHQHMEGVHDHFHNRVEPKPHLHEHKKISYGKSVLIGLVHGLGGSAAMVLLTMSSVSSIWEGAIYILIFGLGTTAGMLGFTTIIGIPFVLSAKKESVNVNLTRMTGLISTAFGLYYMYNLGVIEGLFKLWLQ